MRITMQMVVDPVCGMRVDEKNSMKSIVIGNEVHFCCPNCKAIFVKNPSKYKVA
jgi:YHS domain-containing protein